MGEPLRRADHRAARRLERDRRGAHTLIAAPTGSGKTLAAFLTSLDQLFREAVEDGALPDEVRVIYVSPLKALSADIHKNLAEPRREMHALAQAMGYPSMKITAAVRSGDTPQTERAAMLRTPPHILVTTPESLYLLLTAERSRAMLKTARVVIVDEIHAVLQSRRGAHLALSLERLDHVCGRKLQRIGLSATQKPIEEVARFLTNESCVIVDKGHKREMDLAVEVPRSPLEAVMSHEVWKEIYDRLVQLIEAHRTTLITVNTRRLAERMAHQLSERLGADHVAAHHGSLAKEVRLDAEDRLREGKLKVLVATASLELGIDIGHVDLVCQISSPHRIATFLQRVGRSGHTIKGVPKGRIFPLTRDDLIECAAMVRAVHDGELDRVSVPDKPLDVLAQQIVAEAGAEQEWDEDALARLLPAGLSVSQAGKTAVHGSGRDAGARLRDPARPATAPDPLRQPQPQDPRPQRLAHGCDHERRRDSRGVRLPRAARARRPLHRHAERGLRDRVAARRRVPARQYLVAHPADRQRRRARRRRPGPAAVDAVLARRGAGAQRRDERGGVASARRRGC